MNAHLTLTAVMLKQHVQTTWDHILVHVTRVGLEMDLLALVRKILTFLNKTGILSLKKGIDPHYGVSEFDSMDFNYRNPWIWKYIACSQT